MFYQLNLGFLGIGKIIYKIEKKIEIGWGSKIKDQNFNHSV